jgi:hypothetical protein
MVDREAERLRGLQVDGQLELGGLLDRQIGGFSAFENAIDVVRGAADLLDKVRAVRHRGLHRFQVAFGVSHAEAELLALLESQFPETVPQPVDGREIQVSFKDDSDTIDAGRLRLDTERRGKEGESDTADKLSAVHYWMTSSARSSSDGGIVSRALVVNSASRCRCWVKIRPATTMSTRVLSRHFYERGVEFLRTLHAQGLKLHP